MDRVYLVLIFVTLASAAAATITVRTKFGNNTIKLDLLTELGRAIKAESQSRPITSDSGGAARKTTDFDSLLLLTRQINGRVGDNCSRDDWSRLVRPIIEEYTNRTKTGGSKHTMTTLKNEVLQNNETLHGICLSQTYLMECNEVSKCQCLTPGDYGLDEEYVKCDAMGMPLVLSTFHILALLIGRYLF